MPKEPEAYHANDRVNHSTFGAGTIKVSDSYHTIIAFDDHGTKKFLTQLLRVERSDAPPRKKPSRTARAAKTKTAE